MDSLKVPEKAQYRGKLVAHLFILEVNVVALKIGVKK